MDNTQYRADSVKVYFSSIYRAIKRTNPETNIYKDPRFDKLRRTVDGLIRSLRKAENPRKKQAEEITAEIEQDLRERGFLGYDSPRALLAALIFEIAKLFGLRGGRELRNVRRSQLVFENIRAGLVKITFYEDTTKTNHAGVCHFCTTISRINSSQYKVIKPEQVSTITY